MKCTYKSLDTMKIYALYGKPRQPSRKLRKRKGSNDVIFLSLNGRCIMHVMRKKKMREREKLTVACETTMTFLTHGNKLRFSFIYLFFLQF